MIPVEPTKTVERLLGTGSTTWKPLRLGAGGFLTGLDIARDGTMIARPDTGGGLWLRRPADSEWTLATRADTMPAGTWGVEADLLTNIYEAVFAPSDPRRIYALSGSGKLVRSDDGGARFVQPASQTFKANGNDDFRTFGKKIAVDPAAPDRLYLGTQDGLFFSADAGRTMVRVAEVPASAAAILVAFGPGGKVYAASHGHGVFVSTGGAPFARMAGSPATARHLVAASDGALWLTEGQGVDNLRVCRGGAWSDAGARGLGTLHSIAIDPADPNRVVVGNEGGSLAQTLDGGRTWIAYQAWELPGTGERVATDVPWLAWTNEAYMTNGAMAFDPTTPDRLIFAEGIGVWETRMPRTKAAYRWTSISKGIEQLCSNTLLVPPGQKPVYFAWDRPVFVIEDPDAFPATHGPTRDHPINMGWNGDFAGDNPQFIAAIINWWGKEQSGWSPDGGRTWSKFASVPAMVSDARNKIGGSIAVSTSDNIVWVPSNNGVPYYTKDRGRTWTPCSVPGVPTEGDTGWGFAYYLNRRIVVADKSARDTFYLYNTRGLFKSTDGGVTFAPVHQGALAPSSEFNAKLYAVPGKTGHLFFTVGHQAGAGAADTPLRRSVDGGRTWTDVPGLKEVFCAGFGAPKVAGGYPAVFVVGWLNGAFGLYRSDDDCASWDRIGDYPLGNADPIATISGDPGEYGKVYVGFGGSGGAYGRLG